MCETIVVILGFLLWVLHGLIFYVINYFYPDQSPETGPGSVATTAQSPEGASPSSSQEIAVASQPAMQPDSLDPDCPPSCENPESRQLHHSPATKNGIEDYVETLEQEHQAMRHEICQFEQKFQQLSSILTNLEEMTDENERLKQEVISLRTSASEQEKQREIMETQLQNESKLMEDKELLMAKLDSLSAENRKIMDAYKAIEKSAEDGEALVEKHLSTIATLKSDLDFANQIVDEQLSEKDYLIYKIADLEKLIGQIDRENIAMKMDMKRLNDSVRKRKSDWRISELKLSESNEDLKKKLGRLQTDYQSLLESNGLVKTELESANKELASLREKVAEKEQDVFDFRKEFLETLRAESERLVLDSCEAATISTPTTAIRCAQDQPLLECSALRPSSSSDVDVSQQSSAEVIELQTQIQEVDTEIKKLFLSMDGLRQARKESQKAFRTIENQLYWKMWKQTRLAARRNDALKAAQEPVHLAEEQVTVLPEEPITLKEVVAETSVVEVKKLDELGSAQTKADTTVSNEVVAEASGVTEAKETDTMGGTDLAQNDTDINSVEEVVPEASAVADEVKNVDPISSTDLPKTDDTIKKKKGSKLKRWAKKFVFRKRKEPAV
ncbi:GRIP and coiled-coil domain-containing protein 2-like [Daphnia carinata]|uniref:GRIP and coiled-coil domain-containing protein 2-like n=1 Tax=Daphnia carinata TaxID=120202 RepID=UPI00257B44A7|nr:GRIP and coiled-coil domain-containing protein 2-like [Daphnia carinata]